MAFPKKLKQLCTPAFLYFVLSMLGVLVSVVQNLGNSRRYNLGMLSARVPSTFLVFLVEIIYILFWTWVLNLMCKDGHKEIAWFLVLIPFILLFLLQGSMMSGSEGFNDVTTTVPATTTTTPATTTTTPLEYVIFVETTDRPTTRQGSSDGGAGGGSSKSLTKTGISDRGKGGGSSN